MTGQKLFTKIFAVIAGLILFAGVFNLATSFFDVRSISSFAAKETVQENAVTQAYLPSTNKKADRFEVSNFSIEIPSIKLSHNIYTNTDPRDKEIYLPILEDYVAHGKFTALPSEDEGRVYLFAHSKVAPKGITPYGGYFSHLDKVKNGERITIKYNNKSYNYKVYDRIIVEPTQTDVYTAVSDKAEVALQTCYPPGTTDQRLIVFGELVSVK